MIVSRSGDGAHHFLRNASSFARASGVWRNLTRCARSHATAASQPCARPTRTASRHAAPCLVAPAVAASSSHTGVIGAAFRGEIARRGAFIETKQPVEASCAFTHATAAAIAPSAPLPWSARTSKRHVGASPHAHVWPVAVRSIASAGKMRAGSICVPPQPGQMQSPASGRPICHGFPPSAGSAATSASQCIAISRPPPSVAP